VSKSNFVEVDADSIEWDDEFGFPVEPYQVSDWKESADGILSLVANEIEKYGLRVELVDIDTDDYMWRIVKDV